MLSKIFFLALTALPLTFAQSSAPSVVNGTLLELKNNTFGGAIEGASVDPTGMIYAFDYQAGEPSQYDPSLAFASINGTVFHALKNSSEPKSLLAGSRFVNSDTVFIADATKQRVLLFTRGSMDNYSTFCSNNKMLQPNDIALSPVNAGVIYLTGQNYTADTEAGKAGDIWLCNGNHSVQYPVEKLKEANIHRTNGIETSPCGATLYLSSAVNLNSSVVSNAIYSIQLSKDNGTFLSSSTPALFYNFTTTASTDIDGMRTDTQGNLYVTRNGLGQVVKLSPTGQLLSTFNFPGVAGPSNLELGGSDGKTLYVVGKCASNSTFGCVGKAEQMEYPGKAWSTLQVIN